MIKGSPKKPIRFESILEKIEQYDIYRYYLGVDFNTHKNVSSPFHVDKHPSFRVRATVDGFLYHKDYADATKAGNCVNLVQQLYGLSYNAAIVKIDQDFGLGIYSNDKKNYQLLISDYKKPDKLKYKKPDLIQIKVRKFTKEELLYWEQYEVSEEMLNDNDVYGIKELIINKVVVTDWESSLKFGYFYNPHWKVYRPLVEKKKKWIWNNTPNDRMYGLGEVKGKDTVIVTKSHKDYLCLKSVFPNIVLCQNESEVAVNQSNIEFLQNNCGEVYFFFDCDDTGKRSCKFYNQYGFKWVNVPNKYYQETKTKDPSDLVKNYGKQELINLLKSKNII